MIKEFFSRHKKEEKQDTSKADRILEQRRNDFISSLRVESRSSIASLASKVKSQEKSIQDLTDKELDSMIMFYQNKLGVNKKA